MIPVASSEWRYFSDGVMGGVSSGSAAIEDGALRLRGTVSTANNGGFIQVRTEVRGLPPGTTGLRLRVRGNGARYFLHLRTTETRRPWQFHQAGFVAQAAWREVTLPLSDFAPMGGLLPGAPRPEDIRSIGLAAYGRDHVADVSLSALAPVAG